MPTRPVILANGTALAPIGTAAESSLPLDTAVVLTLQSTSGYTSFAWTLIGRPAGSAAALTATSGYTSAFTPDEPGEYQVKGIATGADGTSSARVSVVIVLTENIELRKVSAVRSDDIAQDVDDLKDRFNDALDILDTDTATRHGDAGVPRLLYNSARSVRAFSIASEVMLNGFRAGGIHSKPRGPVCALDQASTYAYDYTARVDGFGAPGLSALSTELWVAVFARRRPDETLATLCFVPYLKVMAWDSGTRTATFDAVSGAMATAGEWTGCDLLACHEDGYFSWRTTTIASNTATTVTLAASAASWDLAAGDYLLPAPSRLADYKYLRSLKLDYSAALTPAYEWRNFAFGAGGHVGSTTGNPFGNITSLTDIPLDMRGYVSPLATGWTAAIQAYGIASDSSGAALYLSHDQGSLHAVARVAIDRVPTAGIGVTCTVSAPFGAKQETYARVINANSVGTVDILGWTEG